MSTIDAVRALLFHPGERYEFPVALARTCESVATGARKTLTFKRGLCVRRSLGVEDEFVFRGWPAGDVAPEDDVECFFAVGVDRCMTATRIAPTRRVAPRGKYK